MNRLLGGGRRIPLGRVLGFRVSATPTWFVSTTLLIVFASGPLERLLGSSNAGGYRAAAVLALLLNGSILLHELGHAVTARRLGIEVTGIELLLLGGVTRPANGFQSPDSELKIVGAGPAVTLALVLVAGALVALLGGELSAESFSWTAKTDSPDALILLGLLVPINLCLLAFNLLPVFPLDGGQLMHGLIWKRTGDVLRATRIAGRSGQASSAAIVGLGVVLAARGWPATGIGVAMTGALLVAPARAVVRWAADIVERVDGKTAAEVMDAGPVALALPATTAAIQARDDFFEPHGWGYFPVVDEPGRLVGVVSRETVDREIAAGRSATEVGELVEAGETSRWCIGPDRPLYPLLFDAQILAEGSLLVVDDGGLLLGVLTIGHLRFVVQGPVAGPTA
jgi:Zn-dependent protease